jgi:hypothetical protein
VKASVCFYKGTSLDVEPGKRGRTVGPCRSPDGASRLTLKNSVGGWACTLYLTRASTGRRARTFRSRDGCSDLTWATPHLLLFQSNSTLRTLYPGRRLVSEPALFDEFAVSPNRRWVAGDLLGGPESPQTTVYALTVNNSKCVIVPLAPHRTDEVVGFTPDSKSLIVNTAPWNATSSPGPGNGSNRQFRLSSLHTNCDGPQLNG